MQILKVHTCHRARHNGTENNGGGSAPHAPSSTDSVALPNLQQSDESDTDSAEQPAAREDLRKRKRPGPVPKLEHMALQDFQRGGYFDMQIEVSLPLLF